MKTKSIRKSRVVLLNTAVTVLGATIALAPQLVPFVGERNGGVVLAVTGIANVLLRFLTTMPLSVGTPTP